MNYRGETDRAQSTLRTRLELATKERLIEVIVRLAADSEESAVRIDYLTDSSKAVKTLQRRISSIRNGKRFVSYGESGDLAAQIATIAADIRADLLLTDPAKAKVLAEKLFSLDQVVFERADDSGGSIGGELRTPGISTYHALAELLPEGERAELRTRACAEAVTNPDVAAAAELLFELNEPKLADELIVGHAAELNGGFYGSLTSLVEKARNEGCFLAATLILRAMLDAILKRAYAKAYGHGARYLRALQELGSRIDDYRGHPTHEVYEQTLRLAHGRKTSFWARLLET